MSPNTKRLLFKLKYVLAFAVFVVATGFLGEDCLMNRFAKQKEIARLKGEIDEYERKFEQDNIKLNSLKNDPEAVREVARERYFMKTDNEDIFVVDDEEVDE